MTPEQIKKIIAEKITGIWVPEHDAEGHHYRNTKTGVLVDSVTTKLIADKPHLLKWSIKKGVEWLEVGDRFVRLSGPERNTIILGCQEAYTEHRDDAGDIGLLVHAVIEAYIVYWTKNGTLPDDIRKGFKEGADPRAIASARSVEALFKKHNIIPLASELLVGSTKIGTAGTLDFLCLWNGVVTLGDFKTSNNVSDDYAAQVAAYKYMFEEMCGIKIKQCKVFHLSKDYDKFTVYKIPKLSSAYKAYKGIATYYDWLHNGNDKLEKDIIRIDLTKHGHNKTRTTRGTPLTREGDSVKD